jgi:hypothetical protein
MLVAMAASVSASVAVANPPNFDEAAVAAYSLPDVLAGPDGKPVATADGWRNGRGHRSAIATAAGRTGRGRTTTDASRPAV